MEISSSRKNNYTLHNPSNFKGQLFNLTAAVEANTLMNKGIVDIGGFVVPQAIMSNNKDESIERVSKSLMYFAFTFLSPVIILPLLNKHALRSSKVLEKFEGSQKKIIEVSKEYLKKDADYLLEGVHKKSQELFGNKNGFDETLNKFKDVEELRQSLILSHKKVLRNDILITNIMVASIPWLGNLLTKARTNRSGYSGTYKLADQDFTKKASEKRDKTKNLRLLATYAVAMLPVFVVPGLLSKALKPGKNISKVGKGPINKLLKAVNKNAEKFDYTDSVKMSRLTGLIMWATSDYLPYQLACRDKYEYRDTLIRGTSIGLVFWGGDLLLKNVMSKLSDKFLGTKTFNDKKKQPFKFSELKNAKKVEELKNLSPKILKKTQAVAGSMYWVNLAIVMATLGFALPALLNKLLKRTVNEDKKNIA